MTVSATTTLLGLVLVAAPTPARSAPATRVIVETSRCEGLRPDEVGRLLDIELAMVTAEIRSGPPLTVQLECAPARMTITVVDPLTRKRLSRDIPAPEDAPGRERVVALAISQLFAASWLELLTATEPPPAPETDRQPPPDQTAVAAARRVAERSLERTPPRADPESDRETAPETDTEPEPKPEGAALRRALELMVGAGARGRALEGPGRLAGARVELRMRGWPEPRVGVGWIAQVGWDFGQSNRRRGQVQGNALTAGGGLAWSVQPGPVDSPIGLGGAIHVAGGWAWVRGVPQEPGVPAGTNAGVTGEAAFGVGPRVRYRRLHLDLDAEVGAMLRTPVGLVDDGLAMSMGGLWAGVLLRLGGALR
ncbi:MAG: hypothetical protein AAGF11_42290 [Myxococcota bacterium]